MKTRSESRVLVGIVLLALGAFSARAQSAGTAGGKVAPVLSPPLRSLPPGPAVSTQPKVSVPDHELPHFARPSNIAAATDALVQTVPTATQPSPTGVNFDGVGVGNSAPPDTSGHVGPNHYIQWVNTRFAIYDKTGTLLVGPTNGNALWQNIGGACASHNDGDIVVAYDILADRWVLNQFVVNSSDGFFSHQCVAVSLTGDPTGQYYLYDFPTSQDNFVDYPHWGVWPDSYYMTAHIFNGAGTAYLGQGLFAFDRLRMLAGQPASFQYVLLGANFGGALPTDLDSLTPPPAGAPNYILAPGAPELDGTATDVLHIWKAQATWGTSPTFTVTGPQDVAIGSFDPAVCPLLSNFDGILGRPCVPQPPPANPVADYLDVISDRLMYRVAYRNFANGTPDDPTPREVLVLNHTANATPGAQQGQAGVRWYELRNPGSASPTVFQQGTYAPADPTTSTPSSRWMASIAMDNSGNVLAGYSKSSLTVFPEIDVAGRLATDPPGLLGSEVLMKIGQGVQIQTGNRWGDYSNMTVDPRDGCTFWYTTEYLPDSNPLGFNWATRVASFKFPSCAAPAQGVIRGTVKDCATGAPIANALVSVSNGFSGATDSSGNYAITLPPGGPYTVTASAPGRLCPSTPASASVTVTNGGTSTQNFCFSANAPIALSPATLPPGTAGTSYNRTIGASGGTAPYSFAVTSGSLPPGLGLAPSGVLSGTPTAAGNYVFTVTATDASGCTGSQTYSMTIYNPGPPVAIDDSATTAENTPVTIAVLANDSDGGFPPISVTGVTQPPNGTAAINAGGTITYTPNRNFNTFEAPPDRFTYTVSNAHGLTATGNVSVTVNHFCALTPTGTFFDDLEPQKAVYTTFSTRTVGGWSVMTDPTAHSLSHAWVVLDDQPGVPLTTENDAQLVLPPLDLSSTSVLTFWHNFDFARFPGSPATTARYESGGVLELSADGGAHWIDLGPYVTVGGYNGIVDPAAPSPVAGRNAWVGSSDGDLMPGRADMMKQVTVNLGSAVTSLGGSQLLGGLIRFRLGGTFQILIGGVQGTGWGVDDIGVSHTLQLANCDHPPIAVDDTANTTRNTPVTITVLANDSDPDGDPLTVTSTTVPAHGTAVRNANNTVTYTPATSYTGPDSFRYTISDGKGGTASATVRVTVSLPPNQPPVARDDTATTTKNQAVTINVLANDSDPDGDPLTITSVSVPANGSVTATATKVTYKPNSGFVGTDSFTYTISDGRGGTASAKVTVTVTAPPNRPPNAKDDSAQTAKNTPVTIAVLANDSDPDGDALTVTSVSTPAHGTAAANANGTVTYTPASNFVGTDTFSYSISDGRGGTASATVTVIVQDGTGGGKATGGGWIAGNGGDGKSKFEFHAQTKGNTPDGDAQYDSADGSYSIRGSVDQLSVSGVNADLSGPCTIQGNGAACRYAIHAEDHGEPGTGVDRFKIQIWNQVGTLIYQADALLGGGNIQVH